MTSAKIDLQKVENELLDENLASLTVAVTQANELLHVDDALIIIDEEDPYKELEAKFLEKVVCKINL